MSDSKFCKGVEGHITVVETEGKVWHDYDHYSVSCSKCGARKEQVLARRPHEVLLRCLTPTKKGVKP